MEKKTDEGSTQPSEGVVTGNEKTPSVEELLTKLEAAEATNKRLLEESKGNKERAQLAAKEKAEKEKQLAMEKGDYAKLLEMSRAEESKAKAEAQGLKERYLQQEVEKAVLKFAPDSISLEDILNQPSFQPILKEAVNPETLSVDYEKAKRFVDELKKAKPYLFKQTSQPGVVTKKPGTGNGGALDLNKMDSKQIEEAIRAGVFQ